MFRILKIDDDFVYLSHPDGRLKKIDKAYLILLSIWETV